MTYEVVCTKSYLDVGLCIERDKNLKPTRVLAREFDYSTADGEYGGVELLDWIDTGVFLSKYEWRKLSHNKSTDQILRDLGISKKNVLKTTERNRVIKVWCNMIEEIALFCIKLGLSAVATGVWFFLLDIILGIT